MAEQPVVVDSNRIKEIEEKDASKRIETIKKLVPKSVNDTLKELKLSKYNGAVKYFNISEEEVINKLKTEWDNYLEEKKPNITINNISEYLNNNKFYVWHSFWDLVLNEIFIYCKAISNEIFNNSSDIQLCNTLNKCLCVCLLLDVLKCKITSGEKKASLLLKETCINNVELQNIINKCIATKLDIQKWKQNGSDDKKVYKQYAMCLQKEAMKSGKEFVKLYKIYKLKDIKEKKEALKKKTEQQQQKKEKENEMKKEETKEPTKETPNEETKEEREDEAKEEIKEEIKEDTNEKNVSDKQSSNPMFMYAIILAFIIMIIGYLLRK